MSSTKPICTSIYKSVAEDYLANAKISDITTKYNICESSLYNILGWLNIPRTRNNKFVYLRFHKSFQERALDECWPWVKALSKKGYGIFNAGREYFAHRFMYDYYYGRTPQRDEVVMHSCDNPPCVNPFHLKLGTVRENNLDRVRKGRCAKGARNSATKLTAEQVLEIRKSDLPNTELAKIYNLNYSYVGAIKNKKTWRHL